MGDSSMIDGIKVTLIVMLFYSFAINALSYSIPNDAKQYVTMNSGSGRITIDNVGSQVDSSLTKQTNIPVIETAALVFYSGNILIDLLLNFAFAIPEMIGILVKGIVFIIGGDAYLFALVETFTGVLMTVLYMVGLIQLLTGIRSGRVL